MNHLHHREHLVHLFQLSLKNMWLLLGKFLLATRNKIRLFVQLAIHNICRFGGADVLLAVMCIYSVGKWLQSSVWLFRCLLFWSKIILGMLLTDPACACHKLRSHKKKYLTFNTEPWVMIECIPSFVCRYTDCWGSKGYQ